MATVEKTKQGEFCLTLSMKETDILIGGLKFLITHVGPDKESDKFLDALQADLQRSIE